MIILAILFLGFLCIPLLPLVIGYFAKQPEVDALITNADEPPCVPELIRMPSVPIKERREFVKILYFLSGAALVLAVVPVMVYSFVILLYGGALVSAILVGIYAVVAWFWLGRVLTIVSGR